MDERVRDELIAIACSRDLIYYSDLRDLIASDLDMLAFNRIYTPIFDSINCIELAHGRPLLSAVVVNKRHDIPGNGFFKQARLLGVHDERNDREFWVTEIRRVYAHWERHHAN